MWDMTFTCVTPLIHVATWLINMYNMTHFYRQITHPLTWHKFFIWMTQLMHTCDTKEPCRYGNLWNLTYYRPNTTLPAIVILGTERHTFKWSHREVPSETHAPPPPSPESSWYLDHEFVDNWMRHTFTRPHCADPSETHAPLPLHLPRPLLRVHESQIICFFINFMRHTFTWPPPPPSPESSWYLDHKFVDDFMRHIFTWPYRTDSPENHRFTNWRMRVRQIQIISVFVNIMKHTFTWPFRTNSPENHSWKPLASRES